MFSGAEPFLQFGRGHFGEPSREIILNLDQWFRRCHVKKKFTDDRGMMDARQRPITIPHLEPSAQMS